MEDTGKVESRWQRWRENMRHNYRLVVMNNETFEEVGSQQLTLFNVYIALTSLLVIVAIIVGATIAFTPLKQYLPGYDRGTAVQMEELSQMRQDLRSMEKELNLHRNYSENFRNLLVGNYVTQPPETDEEALTPTDLEPVPLSEEEIALRREADLERLGRSENSDPMVINAKAAPLEQSFFVAPVTGEISKHFDPEQKHYGIDILSPKNSAAKSAMDGTIFFADWTQETGHTIGIQHRGDIVTFYKHNSQLLKKVGSTVKAGEAVAITGNTGFETTGPHLHFELWYRGKAVNPVDYINF